MGFKIANQADLEAARIGFHAAFLEKIGIVDALPLEELLLLVPSTTSLEEWQWLSDLPGFQEWTGDRVMDALKAFKLRVANRDWSSGLKAHQNQFKDDKLGLFPISVAGLASAARQHRADFAAQLLINGFDGLPFPDVGNGLAYDGKFFFDATRTTGSNKHNAVLAAAGIDAAELLMQSQRSYDGKRALRIRGSHLIVGPKLEPTAVKLVTQEYLANGESNPYKGRYTIITEPELRGTYDDWWYLADLKKPAKPLLLQMREEISTSAVLGQQGSQNDSPIRFQKGELWFGAEARYAEAYLEPRLIVGSNPA